MANGEDAVEPIQEQLQHKFGTKSVMRPSTGDEWHAIDVCLNSEISRKKAKETISQVLPETPANASSITITKLLRDLGKHSQDAGQRVWRAVAAFAMEIKNQIQK